MKRILSLILAFVILASLFAGTASASGETMTYSATYTVNGQSASSLAEVQVGDEVVVTVTLTRTDIPDGETYAAWGLEIDVNNYGMDYVSGTGFSYSYAGADFTAAPSSYAVGGATGIGNIRFYRITSGPDDTFTLSRSVSVSAVYTVTNPAAIQAYSPMPIVYPAGAMEPVADIKAEEYIAPVTPAEKT